MAREPGRFTLTFVLDGAEHVVVASAPERPAVLRSLTRAEREVVEHALRGESTRRIAAARGVAERTVANQLASAFRKLGVSSRTELARLLAARRR